MKAIYLILFLAIPSGLFAQAKLKKAHKLYDLKAYTEAAKVYDEFIEKNPDSNKEIILNAANAHFLTSNKRQASIYYEKAYALNNSLNEPYLSNYVRSLRSVKEYEKADQIQRLYLEKHGTQKALKNYLKELKNFDSISKDETPSRFTLKNLDINTEYSDFGAVPFHNKVVFSSSRPGADKELYAWNEQPYLSLFISDTLRSGELSTTKVFLKDAGTEFHDATIAFSKKDNTVYFTSSNTTKNKLVLDDDRNNNFKLYKGKLVDGTIVDKEALYFNGTDFSIGHPFVSEDGAYLFFVSDMPGGYGEADIYYSKIFDDGMISNPKNAGTAINTSGNDFFPYLKDDIFYFSSNGRVGFGGLDLYQAIFSDENNTFSNIENLGRNANTSYDDFAITFNHDSSTGYLSSNRNGGKGDDDIYWFYREPLSCNQLVKGIVFDKKSNEKLANATLTVDYDDLTASVTVSTDMNGRYEIEIPCDKDIQILAQLEGYVEMSKPLITTSENKKIIDPFNFGLNKIEDIIVIDTSGNENIKLDPIFFEYNKWGITPSAELVLSKVAEVMKDIPKMIIKIEAHTDVRGTDSYNLLLSDKRAKATQEYLYSQGIAQNRIVSAIGYGETRLLNKCSNGVSCTNEEHDVNRRSAFIIISR